MPSEVGIGILSMRIRYERAWTLLRHAKASTTLDLYSQAVDESKLAAQKDIALAIAGNQVQAD
jgi:hypothetical protein